MNRGSVVNTVIWASVAAAVISLVTAFWLRDATDLKETSGIALLGFWALLPPTWFFFDWTVLCNELDASDPERERIMHSHDLGRNVWIAFVVVLASTMGLPWPFSS